MPDMMTTADVARLFCERGYPLKPWQVRRIYESGRVAEPAVRMGAYRIIRPCDLPYLEAALREAGYLPAANAMALAQ